MSGEGRPGPGLDLAGHYQVAGCPAPPGDEHAGTPPLGEARPASPGEGGGAKAQPPLLDQIDAELARFLGRTEHDPAAPVYYAAARATGTRRFSLLASLGGLMEEDLADARMRYLEVRVRVGDHHIDNTHPMRGQHGFDAPDEGNLLSLPLSDDALADRMALWRGLDDAYDLARRRYLKVRANAMVSAAAEDRSDDFSQEPARTVDEAQPAFPVLDRDAWRRALERLSGRLRGDAVILDSSLRFSVRADRRLIAGSGGSRLASSARTTLFSADVSGRTDDGMELNRAFVLTVPSPADLPDEAYLGAQVERLRQEIHDLRQAPPADAYSGPAILEGRAAAVFFHEVLGHRLEGHRQRDDAESGTFARRVGQVILPPFLDVIDDPTIGRLQGTWLAGCYRDDDEGVAAQRVVLVEHGVLRNFLMGRQPVAGFLQSNGHGRAEVGHDPVARQGNLIVTADRVLPVATLRARMLDEVRRQHKPYGLRIVEISGGFTQTQRTGVEGLKVLPQMTYRIYPDGRPDELIRGVDIIATPLTVLSHVVAAGDDLAVFNGTCGAESGWVPVAAVAPSLLIDQLEVARQAVEGKRPPLLPAPEASR